MTRILVSDSVPAAGVQPLRDAGFTVDVDTGLSPEALLDIIGQYDGLIVRSATKVTPDVLAAGERLRVVGRAGVGVDNIDLPSATQRGIVVMNTPGASSVTVAEHALALLLALVRHIPAATESLKAGRWDKKRLKGRQLFGKTLAVIGIGNIGSMLVDRAAAFGMKVIAYDPFISEDAARKLGVERVEWDALLERADVISLHVPLTDRTRHLIDASTIAKMKPGVFILNCARGGVVNEADLAEALKSDHVAGAALDVFEVEPPTADNPLLPLDNFICSPHLGASTVEAQEAVAHMLAEQIVAFFDSGTITNPVNVPAVTGEQLETLGPWLDLSRRVGALAAQLAPEHATDLDVKYSGAIVESELAPLTSQVLAGLVAPFTTEAVNTVNAPYLAKERGIVVNHTTTSDHSNYVSSVAVRLSGEQGQIEVCGTVFGKREPRIVRVDQFEIDAIPEGNLLLMRNVDVPGIVGRIGTVLGDAGVNIAQIHLSRRRHEGQAFSVINLDSPAPQSVLEQLRANEHIVSLKQITL